MPPAPAPPLDVDELPAAPEACPPPPPLPVVTLSLPGAAVSLPHAIAEEKRTTQANRLSMFLISVAARGRRDLVQKNTRREGAPS
jgi:hypothetical protein